MALRRLCKAGTSGEEEECPAVYIDDDPSRMVAQGLLLDAGAAAEMQQVAHGEAGVALPTETVLRAAAVFLAEQGRPAMLAEVQTFLALSEAQR
jgi:hypothetical protein